MDIFNFMENRTVVLEEVFTTNNSSDTGDLDTNFRKFGHLMEKKVSLWWDITTHEQYIKEKTVPRRLRWDIPINDGIIDEDGVSEWYKFFNEKGIEVLQFLVRRKQRKVAMINQQIAECKIALKAHKETPSFVTLTNQLNTFLERKDVEIK